MYSDDFHGNLPDPLLVIEYDHLATPPPPSADHVIFEWPPRPTNVGTGMED